MTKLTELETRCLGALAAMGEYPPQAIARGTAAHDAPAGAGLAFAVHVDGGQRLTDEGGGVDLPTYAAPDRATRFAAVLKAADPDALVTVVVWADDGEPCHDDATDKRGGGG